MHGKVPRFDSILTDTHPVAYKFFSLIEELRQEKELQSIFNRLKNKNHTKENDCVVWPMLG